MPVRAIALCALALASAGAGGAQLVADIDPAASACTFYVAPKWNPAPADYGPALPGIMAFPICQYPLDLSTFPVGQFTFKATQVIGGVTAPESIPAQSARPGPPAIPSNPVLIASGAPPPPPPTSIKIGEVNVLTQADSGNANLLLAQAATLPQAGTIQSLSFYATAAGGNLRLGLYDASGTGGKPGAKKAETASFVPAVGWNTAPVISPVALPAGNYWLAYLPSSNALSFVKGTGPNSYFAGVAFGPLPATFPTSTTTTGSHWSFYGTVSIP